MIRHLSGVVSLLVFPCLAAAPRACVGSQPVGTFKLTVQPPKGGSALPIRHISSSGSMARALAAVQPAADDSPPLASEAAITEVEAVRRRLVRLAFDVHDGPMQNLAAAGYSVHELNRRLKSFQFLLCCLKPMNRIRRRLPRMPNWKR